MKNLEITQLKEILKVITESSSYEWDIKKAGKELRITNNFLSEDKYYRFYKCKKGLCYTCYMIELYYKHNGFKGKVGTIFIGKNKCFCEGKKLTYNIMKNVFNKIRIHFIYGF